MVRKHIISSLPMRNQNRGRRFPVILYLNRMYPVRLFRNKECKVMKEWEKSTITMNNYPSAPCTNSIKIDGVGWNNTHVITNLIPVLVCKHFNIIPPPSICSIPSCAPVAFLLFGSLTGLASAAMACKEWKVDPMRSHSFVPIWGAAGDSDRWRMSPPDLLTMKRWRKPIIYTDNNWMIVDEDEWGGTQDEARW